MGAPLRRELALTRLRHASMFSVCHRLQTLGLLGHTVQAAHHVTPPAHAHGPCVTWIACRPHPGSLTHDCMTHAEHSRCSVQQRGPKVREALPHNTHHNTTRVHHATRAHVPPTLMNVLPTMCRPPSHPATPTADHAEGYNTQLKKCSGNNGTRPINWLTMVDQGSLGN